MHVFTTLIATAALLAMTVFVVPPVRAEDIHAGHEHPGTTALYAPAMEAMHKNMAIPETGNADVDFVRGMIPHHQGAVDMAKILLAHGKDPALKEMATDIIAAQEKEIAFMRAWLEKNAQP